MASSLSELAFFGRTEENKKCSLLTSISAITLFEYRHKIWVINTHPRKQLFFI
jgi:hypothetical protein